MVASAASRVKNITASRSIRYFSAKRLVAGAALLLLASTAGAAELKGKVVGVSERQVRIAIEGDYLPQVGDEVAISFQIPGGPQVRVGTWKVSKVEPDFVEAEVVTATGKPAVDQIATISSANPTPVRQQSQTRPARGSLAALIQRVTPDIAEALGLDKPRGALVANVSQGGPADKGGIRIGDVIVEFDGREIKNSADLPPVVARTPVEKKVQVKVLRERKEVTLPVIIGEFKDKEEVATSIEEKGKLGLGVQDLTPQTAGVVITSVEPGSPAGEAGLLRGDVILEVDRKPVRNLADYREAVAGAERGRRTALLLVRRGASTLFLALKPSR